MKIRSKFYWLEVSKSHYELWKIC